MGVMTPEAQRRRRERLEQLIIQYKSGAIDDRQLHQEVRKLGTQPPAEESSQHATGTSVTAAKGSPSEPVHVSPLSKVACVLEALATLRLSVCGHRKRF